MGYWEGKNVLVTGGSGFLGSYIVSKLEERGAQVSVPRSTQYDLVNYADALRCMQDHRPDMVIHSAAYYGGIMINDRYPATISFRNGSMAFNMFEASARAGVPKLVAIGTACAYPGKVDGDMPESSFWDGPTHRSVENYGGIKKMMEILGRGYRKEHGMDSSHLILTNLYGPGDTFHPLRSHVPSALMRKFVEAKQQGSPQVTLWGTGAPVREFLYVEDCAEAIVRAAELYNDADEPLNIGTGIPTSIKELGMTISDIVGYEGEVVWDTTKPNGAMHKVLDVSKMRRVLGWEPPTSLRDGLTKTIRWYEQNKEFADRRE